MDIDDALRKIGQLAAPAWENKLLLQRLDISMVDAAVNEDEDVGADVFVDMMKKLKMGFILMLMKTLMILKFRWWLFSIPLGQTFEKKSTAGAPQMAGTKKNTAQDSQRTKPIRRQVVETLQATRFRK